jgi:NitT/TauT family transport system permease protein
VTSALRERAPGFFAVFVFVLGWEFYCHLSGISPLLLPAPSGVAVALSELIGERATWRHFGITLGETLAGFVLAAAFGLALGTAVARSRMLERAVQPFVVASQVVPKVALVPLFVLWFGFGPTSKIVVSAVIAFFPVLTNTLLGMRSIEAGHRDVFRAARGGPLQRFWLLELPAALPAILAGMEMAVVLATIGAVVGEFLGGSSGLGYLAVATMNAFQTDRLFGIIVLLALMGFALHAAMGAMRRVLIPWHDSAEH